MTTFTRAIKECQNAHDLNSALQHRNFAEILDKQDELKDLRKEFHFPKTPNTAVLRKGTQQCIYLCGNSLGLQPLKTAAYIEEELIKWRDYGVEGHFVSSRPWVTIDETCIDAWRPSSELDSAKSRS